ncbi:hypothetical protein AX17_001628 [Amanita inopinata Kibby_2008]|nr:hypothetical protein AX17_001628 [Amanita inopinata Kibby_2008]
MVKSKSRPTTPLAKLEFPKGDKSGDYEATPGSVVPSVVVSSFGPGYLPSTSTVSSTKTDTSSLHSRSSSTTSSSSAASSSRTRGPSPIPSSDVVALAAPSPVATFFRRPTPSHLNPISPTQSSLPIPVQSPRIVSSPALISTTPDVPTAIGRSPALSGAITVRPPLFSPVEPVMSARGQTEALNMKDHSVAWQHTINTVLRLDVARDTGLLAPSPLKLVVIQQPVRHGRANTPQNPRLGAVYLNLAEYVDKGAVERRFLLRESKTNAILKLTIELKHAGGVTDYTAPSLPKGEILNGVASLLDKDLFLRGIKMKNCSQEDLRERGKRNKSSNHLDADLDRYHINGTRAPFDIERLPEAYGAKTTEALIDALFNPIKTTERSKESPFTVYVSSEEMDNINGQDRLDANPKKSQINLEAASMYSTTSSSEDAWISARTMSSSNSSIAPSIASSSKSGKNRKLHHKLGNQDLNELGAPLGGGPVDSVRGWWKRRIGSRPGTPTPA